MFAWFRRLFRTTPTEWRLVHTHTVVVAIKPFASKEVKSKFYFHFSESNKGSRRVEYGCTHQEVTGDRLEQIARQIEAYHDIVTPWLSGRYVPEIPSYGDVVLMDVQKKLSQ